MITCQPRLAYDATQNPWKWMTKPLNSNIEWHKHGRKHIACWCVYVFEWGKISMYGDNTP